MLQKLIDAQSSSNELSEKLTAVNRELVERQEQLLRTIDEVADADTRVQAGDEHASAVQSALERQQDHLRRNAVSAYVGGGNRMNTTHALLAASTVDDLAKSRAYAAAVAEEEHGLVERYRELRAEVDAIRRAADGDRQRAAAARERLADQQIELERQQAQLRTAREEQQAAVDEKVSLLADIEQRRGAYSARVSGAASSGGGLAGRLKAAQAGQVLPSSTVGIMRVPLDDYRLTSPFGNRVHPLYGSSAFHAGLDMAIGTGTPIRAAADGQVFIAESYGGYGNAVVIDHGNGLATLYGHQSQIAARVGDQVTKGQVIGFVGSTGNSTGPHLHWEVRIFGEPTDPTSYIG